MTLFKKSLGSPCPENICWTFVMQCCFDLKGDRMIHQTRKMANAFVSLSLFWDPISRKKKLSFQNALKNQIRSLEDNRILGKMCLHRHALCTHKRSSKKFLLNPRLCSVELGDPSRYVWMLSFQRKPRPPRVCVSSVVEDCAVLRTDSWKPPTLRTYSRNVYANDFNTYDEM